jgi:hypothetical protein
MRKFYYDGTHSDMLAIVECFMSFRLVSLVNDILEILSCLISFGRFAGPWNTGNNLVLLSVLD